MRMIKSPLATETYPAYDGNFTYGRDGRSIQAVTIHHMAGVLTSRQCGEIFQTPGRYGSSHYGIGKNGEIACYVGEENTAWTNSNWDSNCKSVTIETSDAEYGGNWYVSDNVLDQLIRLVADIAKRNNLGKLVKGQNLTWHSMFADTSCPGAYLLSKIDYIVDEANKINGYTPSGNNVNVYYRVKTKKHGWLPEVKNLEDYAGWENSPITAVAIRVDRGSISYKVHNKNGNWLPPVTGYNINDFNNGYAGDGREIDCIEAYYYTPDSIRPYKKAKYKVNNYPWQYDDETTNGQDGYAGVYGVNATKFQIVIE